MAGEESFMVSGELVLGGACLELAKALMEDGGATSIF